MRLKAGDTAVVGDNVRLLEYRVRRSCARARLSHRIVGHKVGVESMAARQHRSSCLLPLQQLGSHVVRTGALLRWYLR